MSWDVCVGLISLMYVICRKYLSRLTYYEGTHSLHTCARDNFVFEKRKYIMYLVFAYSRLYWGRSHTGPLSWEFWKKGYMHQMHDTLLLLKEFLIKMKVWALWYNKRSSPKWVNYIYAHLHLRMLSFWSVNFKNFHFSPKWVHIIISSLSII